MKIFIIALLASVGCVHCRPQGLLNNALAGGVANGANVDVLGSAAQSQQVAYSGYPGGGYPGGGYPGGGYPGGGYPWGGYPGGGYPGGGYGPQNGYNYTPNYGGGYAPGYGGPVGGPGYAHQSSAGGGLVGTLVGALGG